MDACSVLRRGGEGVGVEKLTLVVVEEEGVVVARTGCDGSYRGSGNGSDSSSCSIRSSSDGGSWVSSSRRLVVLVVVVVVELTMMVVIVSRCRLHCMHLTSTSTLLVTPTSPPLPIHPSFLSLFYGRPSPLVPSPVQVLPATFSTRHPSSLTLFTTVLALLSPSTLKCFFLDSSLLPQSPPGPVVAWLGSAGGRVGSEGCESKGGGGPVESKVYDYTVA